MKIALLGGTGDLGKGLALRLAKLGYEVLVGSRSDEKGKKLASEYSQIVGVEIKGFDNATASELCDVAILTIPWEYAFDTAAQLKEKLKGKIVVSPLVPMKKEKGYFDYVRLPEGSAAEKIASILESKVVSTFHSVPAERFADLNQKVDWDLPICGDDKEAKETIAEIARKMGFRPLDAGPLKVSSLLESLTPLIINVAIKNKMHDLTIKFI